MNTATKQPQSKVRLLPNQHVFNTQIHRKVINQGKIIHHNRLLIIGLIILSLTQIGFIVNLYNQINENNINQQIINEEGIPTQTAVPKLQLIPASELT